jgi:hypothetical protein
MTRTSDARPVCDLATRNVGALTGVGVPEARTSLSRELATRRAAQASGRYHGRQRRPSLRAW